MTEEMTKQERIEEWNAWVAERPEKVRLVAERFQPWNLYRLKSSGHDVTIYSFDEPKGDEPITLNVLVLHEYNPGLAFERRVFGIEPDDLELVGEIVL